MGYLWFMRPLSKLLCSFHATIHIHFYDLVIVALNMGARNKCIYSAMKLARLCYWMR